MSHLFHNVCYLTGETQRFLRLEFPDARRANLSDASRYLSFGINGEGTSGKVKVANRTR